MFRCEWQCRVFDKETQLNSVAPKLTQSTFFRFVLPTFQNYILQLGPMNDWNVVHGSVSLCPSASLTLTSRFLLFGKGTYHVSYMWYRVIQKVYTFKNLFYKYYWTYGDVLYTDWRENSQSYFYTLQALNVNPRVTLQM
jgi:hypothetical protein